MSFGFNIGDFITVIGLANKIRKEFSVAPVQSKAISEEVRSLAIVLQDVEIALSSKELSDQQRKEIRKIESSCRNVLTVCGRLGLHWASFLLEMVEAVCVLISFAFLFYGHRIREWSMIIRKMQEKGSIHRRLSKRQNSPHNTPKNRISRQRRRRINPI